MAGDLTDEDRRKASMELTNYFKGVEKALWASNPVIGKRNL